MSRMQIDEAVQDLAVDMAKWLKKAKASTVQYPLQRPKQDKWEAGDPYDEYHSMEIFKRLRELFLGLFVSLGTGGLVFMLGDCKGIGKSASDWHIRLGGLGNEVR